MSSSNRSPPAAGCNYNGSGVADFASPATHTNSSTLISGVVGKKVMPSSSSSTPLPSGNGGSHHTAPTTTTTPSSSSINTANKGSISSTILQPTSISNTSPIHFIRIVPSSSPSDVTTSVLSSRFQRRGAGGASPGTSSGGHHQLLHPLSVATVPPSPLVIGQVTKPVIGLSTSRTQFVQTEDAPPPPTSMVVMEAEAARLSAVLGSMDSSLHTLTSQPRLLPPTVHGVVDDMKNTLHHITTTYQQQQRKPPATTHGTTQTDPSLLLSLPTPPPTTITTHTTTSTTSNNTSTSLPSHHHQHPLVQLLCLTTHLRDKAATKGIT